MEDSTALFERLRSRLFGLAYRMLGVRGDAEDIVQEAYLRWHEADRSVVRNPEAWLVAATTRMAIDRLRRLKTEREAYKGPWLPEPILSDVPPPDRSLDLASDCRSHSWCCSNGWRRRTCGVPAARRLRLSYPDISPHPREE